MKMNFETIADAGTGAGFPGIPLSVFFENKKFFLIERSGKKTTFLDNCKTLFKLNNVTILESSIEDIDTTFDVVTFRAFGNFNKYILKFAALLKKEGFLFAYKGKIEEIKAEMQKAKITKYRIEKVLLPFYNEERHIVITQKNDIPL
jgi:16S rRNA (guanine527-N7)-methyltransferase